MVGIKILAKTEFFKPTIEKEVLFKPKEKLQTFSKIQINLINALVKFNVSKAVAEDLIEIVLSKPLKMD